MMQTETSGTTLNGSGAKVPTGPELTPADCKALAECFASEMDTLAPAEDKVGYLTLHAGAVVRDYFRSRGQRPETYLHQNGAVNIYRSSNLTVEVLSGGNDVYLVFPGSLEQAEKTILSHWTQLKRWATHDFRYYFVSVIRQPMAEPILSEASRVCGGSVVHVGDYIVDDQIRTSMRLYMAVAKVNLQTQMFEGLAWQ